MKNRPVYALILALLLTVGIGFAQQTRRPDQIVKTDNSIIEAVIAEIDDSSILYRKFSAPGGPAVRIDKKAISYVRYSNGDIERFTDVPAASGTSAKSGGKPVASARTRNVPAEPVAESARVESVPNRMTTSTRTQPVDRPTSTVRRTPPDLGTSAGRDRGTSSGKDGVKSGRSSSSGRDVSGYGSEKPPMSVFLTAGGGLSQAMVSSGTDSQTSGFVPSFRGGLGLSIPFSDKISLMPTAEFVQLGQSDPDDAALTSKLNYGQFSLPVQFTSAGSGARFILAAGPFAAYALSGTVSDGTDSEAIEFDDAFNRLQIGAIGQAGVRFGPVSVLGYYATSLTNLVNVPTGVTGKLSMHSFGGMLRFHFGQ